MFGRSENARLLANVKRHIREIEFEGRSETAIDFPAERGARVLARYAKGLLWTFYPEVDRDRLDYRSMQLHSGDEVIPVLLAGAVSDSRGQGVFRFAHRVNPETGQGHWLFGFYEASLFVVIHRPLPVSDGPESPAANADPAN
jgi:hypothetical protein